MDIQTIFLLNNGGAEDSYWADNTVRVIIDNSVFYSSEGGNYIRVRFQYPSTGSYRITKAHIGFRDTNRDVYDIDLFTIQQLTQNGNTELVISATSQYSDPAYIGPVSAGGREVVVSMYWDEPEFVTTYSGESSMWDVYEDHGDLAGVPDVTGFTKFFTLPAVRGLDLVDDFAIAHANPRLERITGHLTSGLPLDYWWILFKPSLGESETFSGSETSYTNRIVIPPWLFEADGCPAIRVVFQTIGTGGYTLSSAYIGFQASSGDVYDIDPATMVQLTQGGNSTMVITPSACRSDPVYLQIDGTRAIVISTLSDTNDSPCIYGDADDFFPDGLTMWYAEGNSVATADLPSGLDDDISLVHVLGIEGISALGNIGDIEQPLPTIAATGSISSSQVFFEPPLESIAGAGGPPVVGDIVPALDGVEATGIGAIGALGEIEPILPEISGECESRVDFGLWAYIYEASGLLDVASQSWASFRAVVSSAALDPEGPPVRVVFLPPPTGVESYTLTSVYIALQATSGDPEYMDPATMVRLTQYGQTTFTITEENRVSDPVDFTVDGTRAVVVSMYSGVTVNANIPYWTAPLPSGLAAYYSNYSGDSSGVADSTDYSGASTLEAFYGLEGQVTADNFAIVAPPLHTVEATCLSVIVFGNTRPGLPIVAAAGDSDVPHADGDGDFVSSLPEVFAEGFSQWVDGAFSPPAEMVAAIGEAIILGFGAYRPHINTISSTGIGNLTFEAQVESPLEAVTGAATIQFLVSGSFVQRQYVEGEAEVPSDIVIGFGRVVSPCTVVEATGVLLVSGSGTIRSPLHLLASVGGHIPVGAGQVRLRPDSVRGSSQPGLPILAFSRDSVSAPSSISGTFTILQFERA